jgi:hypothetical protein
LFSPQKCGSVNREVVHTLLSLVNQHLLEHLPGDSRHISPSPLQGLIDGNSAHWDRTGQGGDEGVRWTNILYALDLEEIWEKEQGPLGQDWSRRERRC